MADNTVNDWADTAADTERFLETIGGRIGGYPVDYYEDQYYLEPEAFANLVHLCVEDPKSWYAIMHRYYKLAIKPDRNRKAEWTEWIDSGSFCAEYMNYMHHMYIKSRF